MKKRREDYYSLRKYRENARNNAVSADVIASYARALHAAPEVVRDLIEAHNSDSRDYSDDEYAELGSKVLTFAMTFASEHGVEYFSEEGIRLHSAISDFNAWYLERVVGDGSQFEASLIDYLNASPYVKGKNCD